MTNNAIDLSNYSYLKMHCWQLSQPNSLNCVGTNESTSIDYGLPISPWTGAIGGCVDDGTYREETISVDISSITASQNVFAYASGGAGQDYMIVDEIWLE